MAHYTERLQRAGWAARSELAGEGIATRTLRFRDAEGEEWLGILSAVVLPGGTEHEIVLRAARPTVD